MPATQTSDNAFVSGSAPIDLFLERVRQDLAVNSMLRGSWVEQIVASSQRVDQLLSEIDGREVRLGERAVTLATAGLAVEWVTRDWRNRLLTLITNPNVAYLLMLLGVYRLFFELSNPGVVLPGVPGAICLVLALYAFHVLPVNWAGIALIGLGLAFMAGEALLPTFGALGIGGAVALLVGSLILIDTDVPAFALSVPLIVVVTMVSALFVISVMVLALRQRHRPVVSGVEQMRGSEGEALDDFEHEGAVMVHGERWSARSGCPVAKGQRVRVLGVDGLVVTVEPMQGGQTR